MSGLIFRHRARGYFPKNRQTDSSAGVEGPPKPGRCPQLGGGKIFRPRLRVRSQEFFSRSSRTITDRRLLPSLLSSCWYGKLYFSHISALTPLLFIEMCSSDIQEGDEPVRLLRALQLLLMLLPCENKSLLSDIMMMLHLVASHEDKNKMSVDNLSTLFTPHLLCPRKVRF
jgi:hypothetical protein